MVESFDLLGPGRMMNSPWLAQDLSGFRSLQILLETALPLENWLFILSTAMTGQFPTDSTFPGGTDSALTPTSWTRAS